MLNPELNINRQFREQVENNLEKSFSGTTMVPNKKVLKKENTCVISLLMFYENRKNMIFKVLISIVYCTMDNYVWVHYMCFPKTKLYVTNKGQGFEKITYNVVQELELLNY